MAIPFLLLPILTRYLTPDDYGTLSSFTSIVSGVSIFVGIKTDAAININYFKLNKKELAVYIGNVILIALTSIVIILFLSLIFQNILEEKFKISYTWILLAIIISLANFITTINTNLWIVEQKPIHFGSFNISKTIINLSLSLFLVVLLLMSWKGRALGIIITSIIVSLVSIYILFRREYISFSFKREYIMDALKFGIPLIPYQLSGWIRNGGIIFLLIYLVGKNETGLYSVGLKFALIISVISMGFSKAWGPYLYRELSKKISPVQKLKIVKLTYFIFIFLILLAFGLTYIAPFIIDIVFPDSYSSSYKYVGYLVFGAAFQGMYLMVVKYIFFLKKIKYVAYVTFTVAVINFILAFILIKKNGTIGAAQANMISFFISFILIWVYSSRVYKMPWNILKMD